MAITTIYRIEHQATNTGPWQACNDLAEHDDIAAREQRKAANLFRDYLNEKLDTSQFPGAIFDFGFSFRHGEHLCASPNKEVVHKWFDTDRDDIKEMVHNAGYRVLKIRIDTSKLLRSRSGMQVAFKREDIKKVDILSIMDLTPKKKNVIITASTNSEPAVKKWTKEEIREKMATDGRWLIRGLLAIYDRQTFQEQANGYTVEDNGIGFNGVDAEILSSIALNYKTRNFISPKQLAIVQKKMPKYAKQLSRIANDNELMKAYNAA